MEVNVVNRQRSHRIAATPLASFLRRVNRQEGPEEDSTLSVCLVSDRRMQEYNRTYRGVDRPTDVLSFPDDEAGTDGERYLGDIVISVPTAHRQARAHGHSLARELKILALHGYLHLLGFDHENDGGQMMRLQRRLERRLLPAPSAREAS